jgi:polyhydroxyalkanoate synthesis regulator protein
MLNIKDMSNDEFVSHLMTGHNQYGPLVQMVVIDCLQRGLDDYIDNKEYILEQYDKQVEEGKIPIMNMHSWVACCEETMQRINKKYS